MGDRTAVLGDEVLSQSNWGVGEGFLEGNVGWSIERWTEVRRRKGDIHRCREKHRRNYEGIKLSLAQ